MSVTFIFSICQDSGVALAAVRGVAVWVRALAEHSGPIPAAGITAASDAPEQDRPGRSHSAWPRPRERDADPMPNAEG
jgi:hypothetical protein